MYVDFHHKARSYHFKYVVGGRFANCDCVLGHGVDTKLLAIKLVSCNW